MIHDQALMIHIEKYDQKVHIEIYEFIVLQTA